MTEAPPITCKACEKTIGATNTHIVSESLEVFCFDCTEGEQVHRQIAPTCPVRWHDAWDHAKAFGPRTEVAVYLGLWSPPRGWQPPTE